MSRDPLQIVEAAYALQLDAKTWLGGLVDAAIPFDTGGGVAAYHVSGGRIVATAARDVDGFDDLVRTTCELAPAVFRAAHRPAPRILSNQFDLPRMLRPFSVPETHPIVTYGRRRRVEAAIGGDDDNVLVLCFVSSGMSRRLQRVDRRLLRMVISHLGAAARLRRADPEVDAWLDPSGRVLDATGPAKDRAARASLELAVRQVERARGALRRSAPEEALALWNGLVHAEWSIVHTVEQDGKRVVVARRNRPTVPSVPLSPTERAVAYYVAIGHPYKLVAYELGLSVSSVAAHLKRAMVHLGVRSRIELARIYGHEALPDAS